MSPCDRLRWLRYVLMTSPIFTRGFSFGMVSPLEGVAYSLTAGVARGIFGRMVPIRQRRGGRAPRPGRGSIFFAWGVSGVVGGDSGGVPPAPSPSWPFFILL